MKRAAVSKGESLLSKRVSLMREYWVPRPHPPPPPPTPSFFFFGILSTGISAHLCPENKVKSETMDMFPLRNRGVPPRCQTLYLLFHNDLATTIWTFHRLLLADIDMFLGRESVFNVIIVVEITHSATPMLVSSIIQPFPCHAKTSLKNSFCSMNDT